MLKEITKSFSQGVMLILTPGENQLTFLGTGFLCSGKGYVLTCAHILNLTKPVFIATPPDPNSFPKLTENMFNAVPVTIAQYDPLNDIALLKFDLRHISVSLPNPSFTMGDERNSEIGSSVGYLGFPFGLQTIKVSQSIISAKTSTSHETRTLMLDSSVNNGNSGGPLIELSTGKIIGIVTGRFSPGGSAPVAWIGGSPLGQDSNISFATGISHAIDLLKAEGIYE
ncbi:S1 family peptidase [Pseudomonas proteolytica]|uniref:S1 family peptidase n=1 Tax=Pseudomonas proteolytica TaxID=219574 RepID=UPI00147517B4|nr:serine protease [Pseudomonas proteolytica]NMZ35359.1 trypsin-like peptidase domain-containing protein [Pseudomonas proteolytica]